MVAQIRAIYLRAGAAERLRPLFPTINVSGQVMFFCEVDAIREFPMGIEVPARAMMQNRSTNQLEQVEGTLMIPWDIVDFWFQYSSEIDEASRQDYKYLHRPLPIGFATSKELQADS